MTSCPLCVPPTVVLWRDARCHIIDVNDADYAGYCRVIWRAHVKEMSDLAPPERDALMRVVYAVESALRELLKPTKINLASLGNQVPHLHWHVIARFEDDPHFPDAIWAPRRREGAKRSLDRRSLEHALIDRLGVSI